MFSFGCYCVQIEILMLARQPCGYTCHEWQTMIFLLQRIYAKKVLLSIKSLSREYFQARVSSQKAHRDHYRNLGYSAAQLV